MIWLREAIERAKKNGSTDTFLEGFKLGLEALRYRSLYDDQIRLIEAGELFKINVQTKAVAKIKESAKARRETLRLAVIDLLKNRKSHRMTNAEIADFLHHRGLSPYKPTSTLRYVSTIVAQERKKNRTS